MAQRSVLCWLATADASGQPNVSPKEIYAVLDDEHIVVANIASPGSARNVRANAKVCLSFIDVFAQKGYKVLGLATEALPADADYARWAEPLRTMAGERFPIHSVFVVRASAVEPILAPSYRLYPAETSEAIQVESALRAYGVWRADDDIQ
jgi:predicted pyridoxine 5'-phosphate oxidase superfamily flavin-nucleotide-binding protein